MEWEMEQKMEKVYQTHINLMIPPLPKDTLSASLTKFNNLISSHRLQMRYICYWFWAEINTNFDVIVCSLCVSNCND